MLAVVCFDLIPEAFLPDGAQENMPLILVIFGVVFGYAIVYILNYIIDRNTNPEVQHIDSAHPHTADDLDELMSLAEKNGLHVILNLILDVMPEWVERDFPDAVMVSKNGVPLHGQNILCRQLGGYPGPCYAHAETTELRKRFARAAFEHFKDRPALLAWDVWNEPETHAIYRGNARYPYLCYCRSCRERFKEFCRTKYGTIERLNAIWGRCYNDFTDVEVPTMSDCVADFVDWREFQMRTLHADAEWRLKILKEVDPKSIAHLHIVVDAGGFSPLTGVDDFECAPLSEIYGSSMVNDPYCCAEGVSAAQGRRFYNAEWHINWGGHAMYPPAACTARVGHLRLSFLAISHRSAWHGITGVGTH